MRTMRGALVAMMATLPLMGWAQENSTEILGPETGALELVHSAIARGAFGNVAPETLEAPLTLTVGGAAVEGEGRLFLADPAVPTLLSAQLAPRAAAANPALSDTGYLRQSRYGEIVWEAEPDDRLELHTDGTVLWFPARPGTLSEVSASIAELEAGRNVALTASGGEKAPAVVRSGRRSVMLLAGVPFDRAGDGILAGQNIGIYPNERASGIPNTVSENVAAYEPPATFYLLDERSRGARVTMHTTLGEMMPPALPEDADRDRHVALSPRLLEFYTAFEETLIAKGLDPGKVSILRGYVSPTDRLRLERQGVKLAEFTRHQYGDALVLVYDPKPKPEEKGTVPPLMGDITGDGQTTIADAEALAAHAKETMDRLGKFGGVGILGGYQGPGASKGTPCLHVDLRGWYVPFREEGVEKN